MAVVKLITVHSERPWSNGLVKRRYVITVTNNLGSDEVFITMPYKVAPKDDHTVPASKYLSDLQEIEGVRYLKRVRSGIPVDFAAGRFNSRKRLLKSIALEAFKSDKNDPLAVNISPYLSTLTDLQLRNLFDKDQVWAGRVRIKIAQLESIKAEQAKYTPEDLS